MPLPNPPRIAIIGSGPAAFYSAEYIQKNADFAHEIDMFERLPTPFGLVRGGVAPDHPKIKSVTKVYDRIAAHPNFRFYGNVTMGDDLTHDDLVQHYHLIIYAVGAQTDRRMNIPGEDLPNSYPATEFVGWYNGHPDYRDLEFDLAHDTAVIIGNGNVAMDVVRILARTPDELRETDIAQHALEALAHSQIKTIYVLGRRGPIQAKFTSPELKELADLPDANVLVSPDTLDLDPLSRRYLLKEDDRTAERNFQLLKQYAQNGQNGQNGHSDKSRTIILEFLRSPYEILGEERVEALKVVKNELYRTDEGKLRPRATGEFETIPTGLIFRSIGYHGLALPGVPFDEWNGVIPNENGRVMGRNRLPVTGEYVSGWIKRGPSGIIGTNKPDAQETVQYLLEDVAQGHFLTPSQVQRTALEALLHDRGIRYVTYQDWQILDRLEQERGEEIGRSRLKFTRVEEMLTAINNYKQAFANVLK